MVLNSYAKINLTLSINKRLGNGLHDINSIYSLTTLCDKIVIKKLQNKDKDIISFIGPYSKNVNKVENSVSKILNLMRKYDLISNYFFIKIYKKIPVFSGFGGGTSNAATIFKFLLKKKDKKKKLAKIFENSGSDFRLFFHNQGYLKNLNTVVQLRKKHKLNLLLVYPNIKCSTKEVYSKVKKFSKTRQFLQKNLKIKNQFIKYLVQSNNDLQSIVEKKYPSIKKLLLDIKRTKGCYLSRMTGSGSACYGLFSDANCSKVALRKLRKKYPKFSFSIAKTI